MRSQWSKFGHGFATLSGTKTLQSKVGIGQLSGTIEHRHMCSQKKKSKSSLVCNRVMNTLIPRYVFNKKNLIFGVFHLVFMYKQSNQPRGFENTHCVNAFYWENITFIVFLWRFVFKRFAFSLVLPIRCSHYSAWLAGLLMNQGMLQKGVFLCFKR